MSYALRHLIIDATLACQPFRQDFHASQGLLAMSLNELRRQLMMNCYGLAGRQGLRS